MVKNKKNTKKNKFLKFKLKKVLDDFRKLSLEDFFRLQSISMAHNSSYNIPEGLNIDKLTAQEEKAIRIISEEYQEKFYYYLEKYKNSYNSKENVELYKKLEKLKKNNSLDIMGNSELLVLEYYHSLKEKKIGVSWLDIYYPDILNHNFNTYLMKKKEFSDNIETGIENKKSTSGEFELTPSQTFLKNFISPSTPYNGILLFHGTGVGKTCTAISIAEQFMYHIKNNSTSKKKNRILVLSSSNVQENFRNEIVNIDKFILNEGKVNGCTGDKYLKKISSFSPLKIDEYKRGINNMIDENYDFKGYLKFANDVENIENEATRNISKNDLKKIEEIKKRKRKEYFSNTIIIIDEAHSIKTDKNNKESKKVPQILENVIRDADNIKLILLTATPMLDSCREIIFLLNLLLINDNRPEIDENDIFDMNDNLKEDGRELLIRKSTGYISYIRGQSLTFPHRLYPDINNNPNVLKISDIPKLKNNNEIIPEKNRIKYLTLVSSVLKDYQYKNYRYYLNLDHDSHKNKFTSEFQHSLMSLNIVFPDNRIQKDGIEKSFNRQRGNRYSYRPEILKKYGRFLKYDLIDKYSCKFKNIFDCIINSTGIIFIYSNFIPGGILPLALFLEQNGFVKYGSDKNYNNLLDEPREYISYDGKKKKDHKESDNFQQAAYITIVGNENVLLGNDIDKIGVVNRDDNKYGQQIKVILASRAGGEGIDLHRIREVHILDPWFNLNKIEQAIGRGIRNRSHDDLPEEERNVTVYQHVCLNPPDSQDSQKETTDLKIYREAEKKQINISKIEYELKRNAINCFFNKKINMLTQDNIITVKTSQNKKKKFNTVDKPFTKMCNYRSSCDYTCLHEIEINNKNINTDTFNRNFAERDIKEVKKLIKVMFKKKNIYNLAEIMSNIYSHDKYTDLNKKFIFIAISELIDNKEPIIDQFGRTGIIIFKNLYYIFKIDDNNEKLVIHESRYPKTKKNKNFLIFKNTEKYKDSKKKSKRSIEQIFDIVFDEMRILDSKYFHHNKLWDKKEPEIIKLISLDYSIDHSLSFENKLELIKQLIINYKEWSLDPQKSLFYTSFEYNIAYKNKSPCGFILKNNSSLIENYKYSSKDKIFYSDIQDKWFKDKDLKIAENLKKSSIFGFIHLDNRNNFLFKFVTDVKLSDTHGVGKVCSHHEKPIIEKSVSSILNIELKKYRTVQLLNPNIKKLKKNTVCLELEMLLRYNERKNKDGLLWFQRFLL